MAKQQKVRRRGKAKLGQVSLYVFLTLLAAFMSLPIVFLVSSAFKPLDELFLFPPPFLVRNPTLDNFTDLLIATSGLLVPFSRYVFNSVVVTIATVVLSVLVACMAAYPLAKHRAPGVSLIFGLVIAALMFAPEVTSIPRYIVVNSLGLIDTYWALILPGLAGTMGVFLMTQFLQQVPNQLLESAKMDGANEWTIFWNIIMPLSRPAWSTLAIFAFIGTWNDYFSALIYTKSEVMKTLPLALQTIQGGAGVVARTGAVWAAGFLTTMPTIIIFLLLQRRVVQTMAYSGIKA